MSAPVPVTSLAISSLSELNRAIEHADYTQENVNRFCEILARFQNDANKAFFGVVRGNLDAMRQVVGLSENRTTKAQNTITSLSELNRAIENADYTQENVNRFGDILARFQNDANKAFFGVVRANLEAMREVVGLTEKTVLKPPKEAVGSFLPLQPAVRAPHAVKGIVTAILSKDVTQMKILDPQSGEAKSACTFHAMQAMSTIGRHVGLVVQDIQNNNTEGLNNLQRGIIDTGLVRYNEVIRHAPALLGGADIDDIKKLPQVLRANVTSIPINVVMGESKEIFSAEESEEASPLDEITNHLYSGGTKFVWFKEINNESFCAITEGNQTIIFDSHKNEMILAPSKQLAQTALLRKLNPNSPIIDGVPFMSFTYALGHHTNPDPRFHHLTL